MSEKEFSNLERKIIEYFNAAKEEQKPLKTSDGRVSYVEFADKPTTKKGEPKTDVYARLKDKTGNEKEIKISIKKRNADFLENKTSATRAKEILGDDWAIIIEKATKKLQQQFENRYLVYFDKDGKTDAGSITLGWKFEILNKKSGKLSGKIDLTKEQKIDVYAGTNLSEDKKDAVVNGQIIKDSGVATYILETDKDEVIDAQDVLEKIEPIDEYVDGLDLYFACKALNYRSLYRQGGKIGKYDGNRPLAVFIKWTAKDGKLVGEMVFNEPLLHDGDHSYENLINALKELGAANTDDLLNNKIEIEFKTYKINKGEK